MSEDKKQPTIVHVPDFQLEPYISQYTGLGKIKRLMFIGEVCPALRSQTFPQALAECRKGGHYMLYSESVNRALQIAQFSADQDLSAAVNAQYARDEEWLKAAFKAGKDTLTRLEAEVNDQKREQERENTLRALMQLGQFHLSRGTTPQALQAFLSCFGLASTPEQAIAICSQIVFCSAYNDMNHIQTFANRVKAASGDPVTRAKMNCALGLFYLSHQNYRFAADRFLEVSADIQGQYNEVMSGSDVATYACLCALASYSRQELKNKVVNNGELRKLLESTPIWRTILLHFNSSRFDQARTMLLGLQNELLLDLHLSRHVSHLLDTIRNRSIALYFQPFSSLSMGSLGEAVGLSVEELEPILAQMIANKALVARLDAASQVVRARHADQRNTTFVKAMSAGNEFLRNTRSLLMRMSLIENKLAVKSKNDLEQDQDEDEEMYFSD